jgi:hypothetical protein
MYFSFLICIGGRVTEIEWLQAPVLLNVYNFNNLKKNWCEDLPELFLQYLNSDIIFSAYAITLISACGAKINNKNQNIYHLLTDATT